MAFGTKLRFVRSRIRSTKDVLLNQLCSLHYTRSASAHEADNHLCSPTWQLVSYFSFSTMANREISFFGAHARGLGCEKTKRSGIGHDFFPSGFVRGVLGYFK